MEVYHADAVQHVEGLMAARRGTLVTAAELENLPVPVKLIDRGARLMLPYL